MAFYVNIFKDELFDFHQQCEKLPPGLFTITQLDKTKDELTFASNIINLYNYVELQTDMQRDLKDSFHPDKGLVNIYTRDDNTGVINSLISFSCTFDGKKLSWLVVYVFASIENGDDHLNVFHTALQPLFLFANLFEAYRDKNEQQPEQQSTSTNPYVFGDDYVSDHVVVIFDKMSFIPELQLQPEQEQQMMQRFEFHAGTTYRNNPVFVYDPTKIQVQLWGGRNRNKHTRRQKKRRQHSYMLCSICRRRTARRMK